MSNMWVTIGVDVMQAEKLWKALVTFYVAFVKAEAEYVTVTSTEIAAREVPVIAPTVSPAN